jgi:hypothetical protein
MGFNPDRVKPKTINNWYLMLLYTALIRERVKTGWLRISIMCQEWSESE